MAEQIRFHLDENVNLAVARGLRRQGIDVTTTPEVGLLGASDNEQLAYIMREERVIFTQDTDFLIIASQTTKHFGIVFARVLDQISKFLYFASTSNKRSTSRCSL